jgi:hypothetical protein
MVSVLLKAAGAILTRVFATLATEEMLEWLLFKVAHATVESTKTKHDDAWLIEFKKSYYENKKK